MPKEGKGSATKNLEIFFNKDLEFLLSKRKDLGWDYWTTKDLRLNKGGVLSLLSTAVLLLELGMDPKAPILKEIENLIFQCQRPDGRFRLSPTGAIYPCHTIHGAYVLLRLGAGEDPRMERTLQHLLSIQHEDGGWRCKKFSYGRGPETAFSNPGPTLLALHAFLYTNQPERFCALDDAVEFLLRHWETKKPLGPCHYGIGTLFHQVEFPFLTYNLFHYVYVLSFYPHAKKDPRFLEAFALLTSKLEEGEVVLERAHPGLRSLSSFEKGKRCALATARYEEIKKNLRSDSIDGLPFPGT